MALMDRRNLRCCIDRHFYFLLPRLGAATVIALIVTGQMIGSHAFDHFGLLGVPEHPANLIRLTEAVLLVLGVVLIRT
jgi:transporter family-2 protein